MTTCALQAREWKLILCIYGLIQQVARKRCSTWPIYYTRNKSVTKLLLSGVRFSDVCSFATPQWQAWHMFQTIYKKYNESIYVLLYNKPLQAQKLQIDIRILNTLIFIHASRMNELLRRSIQFDFYDFSIFQFDAD